jgi:hypothetical protein
VGIEPLLIRIGFVHQGGLTACRALTAELLICAAPQGLQPQPSAFQIESSLFVKRHDGKVSGSMVGLTEVELSGWS